MKAMDLSGQRFGLLVARERVGSSSSGGAKWQCVCDCGGEALVTASNLRVGNQVSCGCHRRTRMRALGLQYGPAPKMRTDIVGLKFGRLTVLGRAGKSWGKTPLWTCRCECGGEAVTSVQQLRFGRTKSCGCLGQEARSERMRAYWAAQRQGVPA